MIKSTSRVRGPSGLGPCPAGRDLGRQGGRAAEPAGRGDWSPPGRLFRNSGWSRYPTGSLAYTDDTAAMSMTEDSAVTPAARYAARSPRLEPSAIATGTGPGGAVSPGSGSFGLPIIHPGTHAHSGPWRRTRSCR